jgi:hypothetical protein
VRAALLAAGVLAWSGLGLSSAAAAPAVTIPITPPEVLVLLYPVENTGPMTTDMMDDGPQADTPVDVEWGGSLVVTIPAPLDAGAMEASLDLAPTEDGTPTRTYSSTSVAPDDLVITDLGGGQYGIALPADDLTNGPFGQLNLTNIVGPDNSILSLGDVGYLLEFTGTGVAVQNLAPQMLAVAQVPCPLSSGTRCPAIAVDAGAEFGITVPTTSLLRSLGLGTLDDMALGLTPLDADGVATDDEPILLTDRPGLVTVTDPYNATVMLPASTPGGFYGLTLVQATGTAGSISVTFGELKVKGIPTAPAPRIVNAGLHSNTGWGEEPSTGSRSPLVFTGAGLLLAAGVVTAAALRPRRRGAVDPCSDRLP